MKYNMLMMEMKKEEEELGELIKLVRENMKS